MLLNLHEIYEKVCVYEDTVRATIEVVSRDGVSASVLGMFSSALTNIEKLTPRLPNVPHQLT